MNATTRPLLWAALGAVLGSLLTFALLVALAPSLVGPRLVRDALTSDPEILVAGSDALRAKQNRGALDGIRIALETPFAGSWRGAAKPDVKLVYFYDYACPYCRQTETELKRLLKEDEGLRIVYREFPILGPNSVAAARLSLAASQAGKFAAFSDALHARGRPTPETITATAAQFGLTPQSASDPAIESEIGRNMGMAQQLQASGTPLIVVGDEIFNSAVGYDTLRKAIAKARAG